MKKIIFTRPDGSLSVVHPVVNTMGEVEGFTEEQALQRALAKLPADAINAQVVEPEAIPTDRTFRNGWKAGAGKVEHDMPKCREIHKDKLRGLRAPMLAALDTEYMRADETGNVALQAQIVAKKQVLRDVPQNPAIAAAQTPEALKAVLSAVLA